MGKTSNKTKKETRVLVAMSGGVDSSVTAALLQKQGYEVSGAYMQCWSTGPYCSTEADRADALRVATQLGIPFQVFDFEADYKKAVLDYFFAEYASGRTPNPDVACNREIKFGIFLKKALEQGFDYIATGHYARIKIEDLGSRSLKRSASLGRLRIEDNKNQESNIQHPTSKFHLLKGVDPDKDQSYFLAQLGQEQLSKALFPIGEYTKKEVRQIARSLGLVVAEKKDSQGICFIGPVSVQEFLRQNLKTRKGSIVTIGGEVLGEHEGVAFYTVGQRQGLKVNSPLPYYVVSKNAVKNEIVVAPVGSERLFSSWISLAEPHWVGVEEALPGQFEVAVRYRQKPERAILDKTSRLSYTLKLENPQKAIAAGQLAVFYRGEELLGSAVIN